MDLVIHYSRQSLVDYNQDMTTILETPVGAVKQENVVYVSTRLVPTRDPPAPPGGELGRPAHPPPEGAGGSLVPTQGLGGKNTY